MVGSGEKMVALCAMIFTECGKGNKMIYFIVGSNVDLLRMKKKHCRSSQWGSVVGSAR